MKSNRILMIVILLSVSACSVSDRFSKNSVQKEAPPQPEIAKTKEEPVTTTPLPASVIATPKTVSQKEYNQLKKAFIRQQEELKQLKASQAKDRANWKQLEEKLLTNFELMDHSVSESLKKMNKQMDSSKNKDQTSREKAKSNRSSLSQMRKENALKSNKKRDQAKNKLIENYSLFSPKKPSTSGRSTSKASTPKPLPPPSHEKIVDETGALKQQTAKKESIAVIPLPLSKDEEKSFTDPKLNKPKNPYALKNRPQVKKLYDKGMNAMINRKYDQAIQHFEEFLGKFPDDKYSDNAQFFLGYVHFSQENLDRAEKAFYTVLTRYEHGLTLDGYKTPDAIYMLGRIALSRKDSVRSQYYFNEVVQRFPDSTVADNARKELNN